MIDIETIGVALDTTGLKAGQRELDNTTAAAKRTADAADDLTGVTQKTDTQFRALESTLGTLRPVLGALGVAALTSQFFGMADASTTLKNQLKLATGSSQDAEAAYKALFDIAQRSRVSFTELGSTFAAISRAGSQLGISQGRLLSVTEAIGNAMTISGGSAASMQAALVQLTQGLSSGTLRGEELNSVMEATPRLAQAIANGMGVTTGKLREMGQAGLLTADQVIRALESQSEVLKSEVGGAVLTVGQAYTNLSSATVKLVGDTDSALGISRAFASGLDAVAGGITDLGKAAKEHEVAISTVLGISAGAAVAGLVANLPALISGLAALKGSFVALGLVLAANPVVLALLGIGAAVGGFIAYNSAIEKTADGIRRTINELEALNKTGPGIYSRDAEGMASWEAGVAKRTQEIRKLRQELALLDNQGLDTKAEDARLAVYGAQAKAYAADQEALKGKLIGTMDALSGVNNKYREQQTQLETLQKAYAAGMLTENEYLGAVGKISAALEKQYTVKAKVKTGEESHDKVMKGVIERRKQWLAQNDEYLVALEMESIEIEHQNKLISANQTELEKLTQTEYERANALEDEVKKQREANQAIGLSRVELVQLEASRLNDAAAEKTRLAAIMEGIDPAIAAEYRRQAEAMRLLAGGKVAGAFKEEVDAKRKQDISDWQKHWDQVSQGMVDSLMQGGKSVAEYLKGLFRTLVLQPILKMGVNSVLGAVGLGGSGAASAGDLGGLSGLSGLGDLGSLLGNTSMGALDIGGISLGGASSFLGYAGLALGAVKLLQSFKSPGEQHTGGFYSSSGADGMDAARSITGGNDAWARDLIKRANPEIKSLVGSTVDSVLKSTQAQAKALGFDISLGIDAGLAANTNGKGKNKNAFGYFNITSGGEVVSEYSNRELGSDFGAATAQFAADMAEAAASVVLAGTDFQKAGETAVQTLQRLTAIQGLSETLNPLGGIFSLIANASLGAREELAALAGGIDNLMSQAGSFVKNYYSQDEQAGLQARMISEALAAVGIDASQLQGRQDYRELVESFKQADLEDPVKQQQIATLLGLGDQFAGVSDYLKENNMTLADAIKNAPDIPILQSMLNPQQATAEATQQMTGQLSSIDGHLGGIAEAVNAAVAAAQSAAAAAGQAASAAGAAAGAASSAAASADLTASRQTYEYDMGRA